MYYLKNAGVSTCFNCSKIGQSVNLCAFFDDDQRLTKLQCSVCGAEVSKVEDETRVKLEKSKRKEFLK